MDDSLPKFILLFPLNYNDGRKVPEKVLLGFKEKLFALAAGYGIAGTVEGAYRMKDGSKQIDDLLQIWIVLKEECVPELKRLVAELCADLGQESMFFERTGSMVEFIPPQPRKGSS